MTQSPSDSSAKTARQNEKQARASQRREKASGSEAPATRAAAGKERGRAAAGAHSRSAGDESAPPLPLDCGAQYVDASELLDRVVAEIRAAPRLAVDTEADSLHHYYEKVCLIQVSVAGAHYVIDPLAGVDLSLLLQALAQKPLIFHGADYDLRMLRAGFAFEPHGEVFDTMLAAQLLGYEDLGLGTLVQRFFGVELPKTARKLDWSQRPLTDRMLDYAVNDTRFLEPLADRLGAELARLGREDWHRQACAALVEASRETNRRAPDMEWRIKGSAQLRGRPLALVRELWRWREAEAKRSDRPPFKILGNQKLVELAAWAAQRPYRDLSQGPALPRNCTGRRRAALQRAVEEGRHLPQSQWPGPPKRPSSPHDGPPSPDRDFVNALCEIRDGLAQGFDIPPSVLAPRSAMIAVARHRPRSAEEMVLRTPLLPWQAEILAPGVVPVFRARGAKGR
ncbi:MAG TPA: HRDC domain-containing protein [Sumerlaeia bacterium]|nr:HRDC domain-containing protein [Sumerlaeia bacterium]